MAVFMETLPLKSSVPFTDIVIGDSIMIGSTEKKIYAIYDNETKVIVRFTDGSGMNIKNRRYRKVLEEN